MSNRGKPNENEARSMLQQKFERLIEQTGSINMDTIEINCMNVIDLYGLSITNYYRLRKFFQDKYLTKPMAQPGA
jgi:hypothetical protein